MIERLGVPPERLVVIRNGVDDRFFQASPLSELSGVVPTTYRSHTCSRSAPLEPRKNHLNLVSRGRATHLGSVDLPLVVAGRAGWAYEEILAASNQLEKIGRVIRLDYVPDEDLPALYAVRRP